MRQTWAVMVDAYRELNAKKLCWITMLISALVVVAFACVTLTPKGIGVLVWEFDVPVFNAGILSNAAFYKLMFQTLGIDFWLTWVATIIGLIATCSMIPDFVAGGSVELTLSKPVTRVRLFLTKYAAGLLFTLLQVLVFTTAVFLLIGVRGGEWSWRVFLAVPIVTLMYSYLFSVCALVGLVSRSAIFSLIATLVVWIGIFAVDTVESAVLLSLRTQSEVQVERLKRDIERVENPEPVAAEKAARPTDEGKGLLGRAADMFKPRAAPPSAAKLKGELVVAEKSKARWTKWHNGAFIAKTVLPKTSETTNLLARAILPESEMKKFRDTQVEQALKNQRTFRESRRKDGEAAEERDDRPDFGDPRVALEVERRLNERSVAWVIGTSLLFEGLLLSIACWVFSRRDF